MHKKFKAFTLVELIVVITILAILWTIWFVSLQGYSVNARDSVKISNLRTIESGLIFTHTKTGEFPSPDDSISITASGTLIRTQWYVWNGVLIATQVSEGWNIDPITGQRYDYSLSSNGQDYQLGTFFEKNQSNIVLSSQVRAQDLYYRSQWESLGVVLNASNTPLHWNTGATDIDILNPWESLILEFPNDEAISSASGAELFSAVYNRGKDLLDNKELAQLDNSLIVYIDTDTITEDGKFKDLSSYAHDFTCYDSTQSAQSCLGQNTETGWKSWKAMKITGGSYLLTPGTEVNTLGKDDSFTYFITLKFFDEDYSPLVVGEKDTKCGEFMKVNGDKDYMYNNKIINKWHSYVLWTPCSDTNYFRVADTEWHGGDADYMWRAGDWVNIVSTYDAQTGEVVIYINGQSYPVVTDGAWTAEWSLEQNLFIWNPLGFNNPDMAEGFSRAEFIFDDFRMYNRALSSSEISKMYELFVNKN